MDGTMHCFAASAAEDCGEWPGKLQPKQPIKSESGRRRCTSSTNETEMPRSKSAQWVVGPMQQWLPAKAGRRDGKIPHPLAQFRPRRYVSNRAGLRLR